MTWFVMGSFSVTGVPLVYEAFNWQHGVFIGAAMRSEATAAAEHKGTYPYFGYSYKLHVKYLQHQL